MLSVLNQSTDALALGAADFLTKPVDAEDLMSSVNRLLGRGDKLERKLLVVDDETTLTEWLRIALTRYGYRVREVHDGETALDQVRAERPDLIVLDLHLPNMDGRAVLRQLQASDHAHDIPVVVLSGDIGDSASDRATLTKLGARALLHKPLNVDALVVEIERQLARLERA
jgi:DNA-binding response OmpR family regulator